MENKLKWGCIQPLTGGMYLGAEEAIGHPAEWILSFNGLDDVKYDKDNNIVSAGNEYNLIKYLEDHNRCPEYYKIYEHGMFSTDIDNYNPVIKHNDAVKTPNYSDIDLVVAVPVCSGLSMATSGSKENKDTKNNNMLWITNYTLKVIQPKIYIFENAPTMMGSRGDDLRIKLEEIAKNMGYSILYYKTDTAKHNNCQTRPRTFIVFQKHTIDGVQRPVLYNFENKPIDVLEYFNNISESLPQSEPVSTGIHNIMITEYYKDKFGENWMDNVTEKLNLMDSLIKKNTLQDFIDYIENSNKWSDNEKEKALKYVKHIKYKKSLGLNYYGADIQLYKKDFPSVQFRSIHNLFHPSGKRTCTVREFLSLMGMPEDFILYGDETNLPRIGQNVPVKTAKFVVSEAVRIINNWESNIRESDVNTIYVNNINETIELVA